MICYVPVTILWFEECISSWLIPQKLLANIIVSFHSSIMSHLELLDIKRDGAPWTSEVNI